MEATRESSKPPLTTSGSFIIRRARKAVNQTKIPDFLFTNIGESKDWNLTVKTEYDRYEYQRLSKFCFSAFIAFKKLKDSESMPSPKKTKKSESMPSSEIRVLIKQLEEVKKIEKQSKVGKSATVVFEKKTLELLKKIHEERPELEKSGLVSFKKTTQELLRDQKIKEERDQKIQEKLEEIKKEKRNHRKSVIINNKGDGNLIFTGVKNNRSKNISRHLLGRRVDGESKKALEITVNHLFLMYREGFKTFFTGGLLPILKQDESLLTILDMILSTKQGKPTIRVSSEEVKAKFCFLYCKLNDWSRTKQRVGDLMLFYNKSNKIVEHLKNNLLILQKEDVERISSKILYESSEKNHTNEENEVKEKIVVNLHDSKIDLDSIDIEQAKKIAELLGISKILDGFFKDTYIEYIKTIFKSPDTLSIPVEGYIIEINIGETAYLKIIENFVPVLKLVDDKPLKYILDEDLGEQFGKSIINHARMYQTIKFALQYLVRRTEHYCGLERPFLSDKIKKALSDGVDVNSDVVDFESDYDTVKADVNWDFESVFETINEASELVDRYIEVDRYIKGREEKEKEE